MIEYKITLYRLYDNKSDTIGVLFYNDIEHMPKYVFTLEDEYRTKKKYSETRIPKGKYNLIQRKHGRIYEKYCNHANSAIKKLTNKYGVIQLEDVPGFTDILIHIGNDEDDTAGCILPGNEVNNNSQDKGKLINSTIAYVRLISAIYKAIDNGMKPVIEIIDLDRIR